MVIVPQTTPPPPKKRRRWPKILAFVLVTLVVFLTALAIAAPYIAAPYVKDAIKQSLEENLNGTAEVGAVSCSWSGRIQVRDIKIKGRSGDMVVEVTAVEARVDLWRALKKDYDVNVSVVRPRLNLRNEPDGRTNLEHLIDVPPSPGPPNVDYALDLKFGGGRIKIVDASGDAVEEIEGGLNHAKGAGAIVFNIDFGTARSGIGNISGDFSLAGRAPNVRYDVTRLDLAPFESMALGRGPLKKLGGLVSAKGTLSGLSEVRGSATIEHLVLGFGGEHMAFPTIETKHHLDPDGKFELNIEAGGALKGHATGVRKGDVTEGAIDVTSDLAELGEALRQILHIKEGMKMRGAMTAHAEVAIGKTADGKTYDVKSTVALDRVVAVDAQGREVPVDPHVEVAFDGKIAEDQVVVDRFNVTSQTVTADASGAVTGISKGGTLSARDSKVSVTADLDLLEQRLASFVDLGSTHLSGKVKFAGTMTGAEDGFSVAGSGTASNLAVRWPGEKGAVQSVGPLDLALDADAAFVKSDATIRKFSVRSSAATMAVTGTLRDATGDVKGDLDYAATIVPAEFTKAVGPWMKGVTLAGAPFDVSGHLGGRLKALEVKANGSAKGLTVAWLEGGTPQAFGPFDLLLEGGEWKGADAASAQRLELASAAIGLQAHGTVRDLAGDPRGDVEFVAHIGSDEFTKTFARHMNGVSLHGGSIDGSGHVTGRLKAPGGKLVAAAKGIACGWSDDTGTHAIGPGDFSIDTGESAPDGTIPINRAFIGINAGWAEASGKVRDVYGEPKGELEAKGSIGPNEFTKTFGAWMQGVKLSGGAVDFTGTVSGVLRSPGTVVKATAHDLSVDDGTRVSGPLTFTVDATTRGADFESITVESSAVSGSIKGSRRDFNGKATIQPAEFSRAFKALLDNQTIAGAPIEVSGRFAGDATNFATRFAAVAGDLVVNGNPVKAFRLDADVVKKADAFEKLNVSGPGINVTSTGPAAALTLHADVEPDALSAALGPFLGGTRLGGRGVTADLTVTRGAAEKLKGHASAAEFRGEGGFFGARKFSERDLSVDFDFDYGPELIDVRTCAFKSANGAATATGKITKLASGRQGNLDVTADGDLATVLASYLGRVTPAGGTEYAGRLSIQTKVVGDKDVFDADGALTISNLTVKRGGTTTVDPSFQVRHKVTIALQSKTAAIRYADITSAWMHGRVTGGVLDFDTTPTLSEFNIDMKYAPEAFGQLMELFLPGKFVGKEEQKLGAHLNGTPAGFDLLGLFNGTSGELDIDLKSYQIQGVTMEGPLHGSVGGGYVHLDGRLAANGGTVVVHADADFRNPPQCVGSAFDIKGEGIRLSKDLGGLLTRMSPIFGGQGGTATGTMRLGLHGGWLAPLNSDEPALGVAKRAFNMAGDGVTIPDLEVKNSPTLQSILQNLGDPGAGSRGEFRVTDLNAEAGNVRYSNMVLTLQGMTLKFKGRVDFDGNLDLRMEAPITKILTDRVPELKPILADTMEVPIRGTVSDPKLDWGAAFGNAAKKAAEKTLENQLKHVLTPKKKKNP